MSGNSCVETSCAAAGRRPGPDGEASRGKGRAGGRRRLLFPDLLRGATLLSMIGFHGMWDAVYLYGVRAPWYGELPGYVWQQSICWTFFLLSGFSSRFSRSLLRRGAEVFLAGALVTAVTLLVLPEDRVVFGVLTCIGTCMLLTGAFRKLWPEEAGPGRAGGGEGEAGGEAGGAAGEAAGGRRTGGLLPAAALFFVTRDVNAGYLGFERLHFAALPPFLYRNLLTTYLGFPAADFFSTDYFSVIPWLFLFLCGYCLNPLLLGRKLTEKSTPASGIREPSEAAPGTASRSGGSQGGLYGRALPPFVRALAFLGRHTLPAYLLHQPLLVLFFELLF